MKQSFIYGVLLSGVLALTGCGKDEPEHKPVMDVKDTFAAPQLEALEKAKQVEQTLRDREEAQRKALEQQGL